MRPEPDVLELGKSSQLIFVKTTKIQDGKQVQSKIYIHFYYGNVINMLRGQVNPWPPRAYSWLLKIPRKQPGQLRQRFRTQLPRAGTQPKLCGAL